MPLVVDASVAFKWFVPEIDDDRALALLDGAEDLWAPDLIFAEVANAMWARLRTIAGGRAAALHAQTRMRRMLKQTVPSHELVGRAIEIGFDIRHPLYDCVYLAFCEREGVEMITADDRLLKNLVGTSFAPLARPLNPSPSPAAGTEQTR